MNMTMSENNSIATAKPGMARDNQIVSAEVWNSDFMTEWKVVRVFFTIYNGFISIDANLNSFS